jgi:hypothetical protein
VNGTGLSGERSAERQRQQGWLLLDYRCDHGLGLGTGVRAADGTIVVVDLASDSFLNDYDVSAAAGRGPPSVSG